MRISDWSSDVCSSDLGAEVVEQDGVAACLERDAEALDVVHLHVDGAGRPGVAGPADGLVDADGGQVVVLEHDPVGEVAAVAGPPAGAHGRLLRSEEHTSELQSLMRISYAVFCFK